MATAGGGPKHHWFFQFLRYYNHLLNRYKYPVQIATGGFLWGSGDLLCQGLVGGEKKAEDHSFFDWSRTGRMTIYGLCFSAPTFAFWYGSLDKISHRIFAAVPPGSTVNLPRPLVSGINLWRRLFPLKRDLKPNSAAANGTALYPLPLIISGSTLRTWKIIGFKLAADTLIFDPLYLSLFFTMTSRMEGRSAREIGEKLRTDLLPTWLIDMAVWMPIQTINFRWVPVIYQALVVQSCNIGWNAYLSYVQHAR